MAARKRVLLFGTILLLLLALPHQPLSAGGRTEPTGPAWPGSLTRQAELAPGRETVDFGQAVAVDGDTVVVGAHCVADVFVKPAGGWADATPTARLSPPETVGCHGFGGSVAIGGEVIAVGAPGANAVHVFVKPAGGWVDTDTSALLHAGELPYSARLGASVAIDGDVVVAGAPGIETAYVFVKPAAGWPDGSAATRLDLPSAPGREAGAAVAVHAGLVAVGAPVPSGQGPALARVPPSIEPAVFLFGARAQPWVVANPGVCRPGEVTTVIGGAFPPSAPVVVSLILADGQQRRFPGHTTVQGRLVVPVSVFPHSPAGGAVIEVGMTGTGIKAVTTLLVQAGTQGPPRFLVRH